MNLQHTLAPVLLGVLTLVGCPAAGPSDSGSSNLDGGASEDAGPIGGGDGPRLVVEPARCDFEAAADGEIVFCDATWTNTGNDDLIVSSAVFDENTLEAAMEGDPGFRAQTLLFFPSYIAPGTSLAVRLAASPMPGVAMLQGDFVLSSNDAQSPETAIPLTLQTIVRPVASAEVSSVNGIPVGAAVPPLAPLDDIVLTAQASAPSPGATSITAWQWELIEAPASSQVTLSTPTSESCGFQFNSGGVIQSGVDLFGTYRVRLTVTDDTGITGEVELELEVRPAADLFLELTWQSDAIDLDLHLIKDGGPYCSAESCFYANCLPDSFFDVPEWDGIEGRTAGDPMLSMEESSTYRRERMTIEAPVSALYRVAVHRYSSADGPPIAATVRAFAHGQLLFEATQDLDPREQWETFDIDWGFASPVAISVDALNADWSCP